MPPNMGSQMLFLFALAVGAAPTAAVQTVALFEIKVPAKDAALGSAILDIVTQEVSRVPGYKVISAKEIQAILTEESRKQLSGCDNTSCLSELAGALNAELLISGEVAPLGTGRLLTLQLINHRYANVMNRVALTWTGPDEEMPAVAQAASQLLVVPGELRKPGRVTIKEAPLGAQLTLDDRTVVGMRVEKVEVGVHVARVTAAGFEAREIPFVVRSAEDVQVPAPLSGIPIWRRAAFWVVGLGVVGTVSVVTAVLVGVIPAALLVWNFGGATVTAKGAPPRVLP